MRKHEFVHKHGHTGPYDGGALNRPDTSGGGSTGGTGGGSGGLGVTTLGGLDDVTLTSSAAGDRLRFDGSFWVNSALVWKNVMVLDPTSGNYLPVTTGAGEAVYTETL